MASFLEDFTRDIPRGLSTRYLKQQTAPQARWQSPELILERKALGYDPGNPGGQILIGALGGKLGRASVGRAALRVTLGGALAMAITFGVGRLLGVAGI